MKKVLKQKSFKMTCFVHLDKTLIAIYQTVFKIFSRITFFGYQ